jgi:ubiquinone/menaquinone biosynthesis C-methylase UbiE
MCPHVCPSWLSFTLTNRLRRWAQDPGRILAGFIAEGDLVLDAGCGPGFFTIPMARMVGERGLVVAVDLSPGMLDKVRRRAEKAGLAGRIKLQPAEPDRLGLGAGVFDFALAFWMVHEVGDVDRLLGEIRTSLKPGAAFLLVEPRQHVGKKGFETIVARAEAAGFRAASVENVRLSQAVAFRAE